MLTTALAVLSPFGFIAYYHPKQYSKIFPWLILICSHLATFTYFLQMPSEYPITSGIVFIGLILLRLLPILKLIKLNSEKIKKK
jgi:hypothetical protein